MKYTVAILKSEEAYEHESWISACKDNSAVKDYDVIDLTSNNWLSRINAKKYDVFLLRPSGRVSRFKRLCDERVYILFRVLKKRIYPSIDEIFLYENKKYLRDWLLANNLPHPETFIFFNRNEAEQFLKNRKPFPLVGKTNIGASGNGVVFLTTMTEALQYVHKAFTTGIKSAAGPKIRKGSLFKKIGKMFSRNAFVFERLKQYKAGYDEIQKGFIILQEYIPHEFEWRCVRIGESFFAHKKISVNNKSSGTLKKGYGKVPLSLLDFVKSTTESTGLNTVAIDIFEHDGIFLINEIQCFFGQSDPHQMLVDNRPGRYIFTGNEWRFEEGAFNTNMSYDLRLKHALSLLEQSSPLPLGAQSQ